jgi:hypothetical protein
LRKKTDADGHPLGQAESFLQSQLMAARRVSIPYLNFQSDLDSLSGVEQVSIRDLINGSAVADTITASCKTIMDGKEIPEHPTTLKRVKSSGLPSRTNYKRFP